MLATRIRIRYFNDANRFAVPRRQYRSHPRLVDAVLDDLRNGVDSKTISARVGCPLSTVYRWRKKLQECPEFHPLSPRSAPNRIFSEEEESSIAAMIRGEFLTKGLLFTDAEFRALIMDQYLSKYRDAEEAPSFQCSNGFVYDFKRRHGFSSRKGRIARRPPTDQTSIQIWREQISHLLETCDRDRILNCDETSWTVFPNNILTWADVGAECVPLKVNGDEKNCLTVLATVTANGGKLPLFFIAKGLTDRVLDTQIGDVSTHWRSFSKKGWQTADTFQEYLMHLREHYGDQEVHLLLDLHSSHRAPEVKLLAESLNIRLWFIPAGCTDILQPLDRRCFGALKATARKLWRERVTSDPQAKLGKKDAVAALVCAWEHLSQTTIEEAWEISSD